MGLYVLFSIIILITAVLIVLVVLVQNSKGGGLASNFAGSNQFMGVRKTADFLEKATWTLALILLVLSLSSIFIIPRGTVVKTSTTDTELRQKLQENPVKPIEGFQQAPEKEE